MKIAVGSTNPVKLNAVKSVLKPLYPQAEFIAVSVDSQVSHQPLTMEETKLGAQNRALKALKKTKADLGFGLEGGVFTLDNQMYSCAWCAVVDQKQTFSFGGGMCFLVPDKMKRKIEKGGEMGPIMDQLTGTKNIKQKGGAISILTKGLTTRTQGYQELVRMALVKLRQPQMYS